MFFHIFIYRLKCLLRNKDVIFWTLAFPLFLATFFHLALSNIDVGEKFNAIDIAVVDDGNYKEDEAFRDVLDQVSKGDDRLFNLKITSKEQARKLLRDNKIKAYIQVGSPIKMFANQSGLNQNIVKSFIDQYMQTTSAITSIAAKNPMNLEKVIKYLGSRESYVREVSATSAEPNATLSYFYTLIAMACFYGSMFGNREIIDIQADISPIAARINVSPVHKLKTFLYSMSASLLIHFMEMLLLMAYLVYGLKVDFGEKSLYVLLTVFIGSVTGLSFGAFVSSLVKKSEDIKISILIAITMLCSFLAGMMYQNMKYIIAQNVPILSYLNPLNLLTDALYSLYYYDTLSRYTLNMSVLLVFILVFSFGTYFIIRRRKYASL